MFMQYAQLLDHDLTHTPVNKGTSIAGFEVLTAVSTKMAVFWFVAPCSLAEVYQRFRGPCCLHPDNGGSKDL
jgi:hypothetical protein